MNGWAALRNKSIFFACMALHDTIRSDQFFTRFSLLTPFNPLFDYNPLLYHIFIDSTPSGA